jgi:hypothetical protein
MAMCDVFVVEDDVQFERQGFRNRNRVKLVEGVKWLTVPVEHAGKDLPINEVRIANIAEPKWAERHWLTLQHNYKDAPFWEEFSEFFEEAYGKSWDLLIDLNMHLIKGIMGFLGIEKRLILSSALSCGGKKSELVLNQDQKLGATIHLAGAGAREYLDVESFRKAGITVVFQEFLYPVYEQLHGAFVPDLSVVDYLFCTGGKPWRNADGSLKERV